LPFVRASATTEDLSTPLRTGSPVTTQGTPLEAILENDLGVGFVQNPGCIVSRQHIRTPVCCYFKPVKAGAGKAYNTKVKFAGFTALQVLLKGVVKGSRIVKVTSVNRERNCLSGLDFDTAKIPNLNFYLFKPEILFFRVRVSNTNHPNVFLLNGRPDVQLVILHLPVFKSSGGFAGFTCIGSFVLSNLDSHPREAIRLGVLRYLK